MSNVDPYHFPSFYCCYLLSSLQPKAYNAYIGSTPDPVRRLRQHNGDIKGGAKKTIKNRPWEMLLFVYGFPSRLAALQFEWIWQNPHKSRHLKSLNLYRGSRKEFSMQGKITVLQTLLGHPHWNRWPLSVHIIADSFDMNFFPDGTHGDAKSFLASFKEKLSTAVCKATPHLLCFICHQEIESIEDKLSCYHEDCQMIAHMECLSDFFLDAENKHAATYMIPKQGNCPMCFEQLIWGSLIVHWRMSLRSFSVSSSNNNLVSPIDDEASQTEVDNNSESENDSSELEYEIFKPTKRPTPTSPINRDLECFEVTDSPLKATRSRLSQLQL